MWKQNFGNGWRKVANASITMDKKDNL